MSLFFNARVLVTGGTGLIGTPLVELLIARGAEVRIASLDDGARAHPAAEFRRVDLADFGACQRLCEHIDIVFHVAGIKGSPKRTAEQPASFFVPLLQMNTNMMEAARRAGVAHYLYTSTIGVYAPAETLREDDVWRTWPSPNDRFAGWAKRMGELQAEAYAIEYGWDAVTIVRPANVYGPGDTFDPATAMVIPSLIRRALDGEDPLTVWGDGSAVRDFIHARDVARGMLAVMESGARTPVNLGSGFGVSIGRLVEIIVAHLPRRPRIVWDTTQPTGDRRRVMDTTRARALGFAPSISIEDGIGETVAWYRARGKAAA